MYVNVSSIFPPPPAEFLDATAEENQTHSPTALYSAANEKVDLIRPDEQSVSPKSSLTSLLARSRARSSFRDFCNASWRNYGPVQNSLDNAESVSSKTSDNNDTSPDNGEETMQRSSFRRSSKPIRRRSTIRKAPRPEIHLDVEPQGADGYTQTPSDTKSASSEDTEEVDLYLAAPLDEAYGAGACRPKVLKPVAAPRKNKTNHLGTDNPSFQPPVVLNPQTSNPSYSANANMDCRPKIYRRDPAAGTNPVPSEQVIYDNDTTQQVPTYQNVGPALRGAQSPAAISRTRESADNDSVFLELILTGDEHCVEDWPVGSPELDPNFRPTGSFRLRRESLSLKDLEEVIPELTKKSLKRRTLRRFKSKTKITSQQNQDPQGAASNDVSSNSATMTSSRLPSPDPQLGATCSLSMSGTLGHLPSQGAHNSSEDLESNPWVNFGNSSGDSAPVNPLAANHPRHSPYRSLGQAAAVNPLPIIYEAHNIPPFNAQAGAQAQAGNNMLADMRDQEDDGAVDDATAAAMADWLAAQMDEINRARDAEEEEEADGDTDSLMEWWYTVEEWNELPQHVNNMFNQEEERRTFSILIDKVRRALIVFYRVFTECAEILWQSVIVLHAIADDIKKFHRGAVIASITGGVAMGLGGVAVLVGLILAPITLGFSLIATVAGLGVATIGGVTTGTALLSDGAHDKKDRKKAAAVLVDNENYLLEMQKILNFISTGLLRLRDHPVLLFRRGIIGDEQEIQKAVQMQRLLTAPVSEAFAVTTRAVNAVQGMFSGVNRYFVPGRKKLKKSYITMIVAELKGSANVLQSCVFELNNIKNQLQVATERCGLTD